MVGSKPLYVALAQRKEERRARLQAAFAQMRTLVGPAVPTSLPMYHPDTLGMAPQMPYYGLHPLGPIPLQLAAYSYQPQIIKPGGPQMPNFIGYPNVPVRQGQQGQWTEGRRGGAPQQPQQQMIQRGGNQIFRYTPMRETMGVVLPVPLELGVLVPSANYGNNQPLPISALASALASTPPEQQCAMLGEQLYPLVDMLKHDFAGKVTGMLLEMDQIEVLHLIESPEALKAKVAEAMEVLRMAQVTVLPPPSDQLGSLSLGDLA